MRRIWLILIWLLAATAPAFAQTAAQLPNGLTQFEDANGVPYSGGSVFFYVPGTTTPKTTWLDPYQATPASNPVILDSAGRSPIWGNGIYRQVLQDQFGNTIWDQLTYAAPAVANVNLASTGYVAYYSTPTQISGEPVVPPPQGGTGVANTSGETITLGGAITTSGPLVTAGSAGAQTTFTLPASAFNYTFPSTPITATGAANIPSILTGTWTPTDASGVGLSFGLAAGEYTVIGNMVFASGTVLYPVNASGVAAAIGGLPFPFFNGSSGCYATFGVVPMYLLGNSGLGSFYIDNPSGGGHIANSILSNSDFYFQCVYSAS